MKFTVDVEDFYLEEEDLNAGLQQTIKSAVVNEIQASIKEKVRAAITEHIKFDVETTMHEMIRNYIQDFINNDKIKGRYTNDPELSVKDWARQLFVDASNKPKVDEFIKKLANEFAGEMKQRYDLLFASQLVAKLSDNGLMKEDAIKLLIDKP